MTSVLFASAALMTLCGQATAQNKPPIKLGTLMPMTGFVAVYGEMFVAGMRLGVEDVNAAGGVNGSKIELQVEDDQFKPEQSVLLFRKLVSDGAFAILGPVSGTAWENVSPVANQMKTPAVNFTALKPGITVKPWAIRIQPPDDTMVPEGVAEFVKKFPNVKKIVVAGDTREASSAAAIEEYKKVVAKFGLQVVEILEYQTGTTDFSPIAIKIRGHAPDAVFISSLGGVTLRLLKELEAQNFDKPVLVTAQSWTGPIINLFGSAGKNLYAMGFNTNEPVPGNPKHADYTARFLKWSAGTKIPQPANVSNTTMAYDTVMLLADMMRKAKVDGSTKPEQARVKITEALSQLKSFDGINKITIRDTGDGHIQTHLLKADVERSVWVYALPPEQRIKGK
jgi:branched-chain amino acid transport system substrate-binding protein